MDEKIYCFTCGQKLRVQYFDTPKLLAVPCGNCLSADHGADALRLNSTDTCNGCVFFYPHEEGAGDCRRMPPIINNSYVTRFPIALARCGEYRMHIEYKYDLNVPKVGV